MHFPTFAAFLLASALPAIAAGVNGAESNNFDAVAYGNEIAARVARDFDGRTLEEVAALEDDDDDTAEADDQDALEIRDVEILTERDFDQLFTEEEAELAKRAKGKKGNGAGTRHCSNQGQIKRVKAGYGGKCNPGDTKGYKSAHNCKNDSGGKSYLCVQSNRATCYTISEAVKRNFENGECFR